MVPLVACLDIGTLSVLLAVGERGPDGRLLVRHEASRVVRLGEGLAATGRLSPEAIDRTVDAIRELTADARARGAVVVAGAGTAAMRDAENTADLVARVRREADVGIEVISAAREAALTIAGVRTGRSDPDPLIVVDVGGGSTEITVETDEEAPWSRSLPLGALRLVSQFGEGDREAIADHVSGQLPDLPTSKPSRRHIHCGVGGTITTLAALDLDLTPYDANRIEGHVLARATIGALRERLAATPVEVRRRDPVLESGRADVIVHGAVVYEVVLDRYGWDAIEVSPRGLREGLLSELLREVDRC